MVALNWREYFSRRTRKRDGTVIYFRDKAEIARGSVSNIGHYRGEGARYSVKLISPIEIQGRSKNSLAGALLALDSILIEHLSNKEEK